jgi:hypothetical protein
MEKYLGDMMGEVGTDQILMFLVTISFRQHRTFEHVLSKKNNKIRSRI